MSDDKIEEKPKTSRAKRPKSQTSPENGKLGGRPKIELNEAQWTTIEKACEIHCTGEEIAALCQIDFDTLSRAIKDRHALGFSAYYAQKSAGGKRSLRRRQYDAAMTGNATMMIWLGKQWLNQTDKQEITGDEEKPIVLAYPLPIK